MKRNQYKIMAASTEILGNVAQFGVFAPHQQRAITLTRPEDKKTTSLLQTVVGVFSRIDKKFAQQFNEKQLEQQRAVEVFRETGERDPLLTRPKPDEIVAQDKPREKNNILGQAALVALVATIIPTVVPMLWAAVKQALPAWLGGTGGDGNVAPTPPQSAPPIATPAPHNARRSTTPATRLSQDRQPPPTPPQSAPPIATPAPHNARRSTTPATRLSQDRQPPPTGNGVRAPRRFTTTAGDGPYQNIRQLIIDHDAGRHGYNAVVGRYGRTTPTINGKKLTEMTIAEVQEWQSRQRGNTAVGGYQFIRSTLNRRLDEMQITPEQRRTMLFDQQFQDRLANFEIQLQRTEAMRTARRRARTNRTTVEQEFPRAFEDRLARTWAALPVTYNQRGQARDVQRGDSYYEGYNGNRAHLDPRAFEQAVANDLSNRRPTSIPTSTPHAQTINQFRAMGLTEQQIRGLTREDLKRISAVLRSPTVNGIPVSQLRLRKDQNGMWVAERRRSITRPPTQQIPLGRHAEWTRSAERSQRSAPAQPARRQTTTTTAVQRPIRGIPSPDAPIGTANYAMYFNAGGRG